jgi:hypothetical protein
VPWVLISAARHEMNGSGAPPSLGSPARAGDGGALQVCAEHRRKRLDQVCCGRRFGSGAGAQRRAAEGYHRGGHGHGSIPARVWRARRCSERRRDGDGRRQRAVLTPGDACGDSSPAGWGTRQKGAVSGDRRKRRRLFTKKKG